MADGQRQVVQWFPGHMAKTRRQIRELLPLVDAVTVLLDARIPDSSKNPEIDELIGAKPCIYLLNKCDLADDRATAAWLSYYRTLGKTALAADCRSGKGLNKYRETVRLVCADRLRSNEAKGMAGRPLRIMVVGIPNTGKSSFINRMSAGSRAKVEDRAGVTRNHAWFVIGGGIELLDTPGVLWPKFEDKRVGDRLAFTGGIRDQVLDPELMAVRLLEVLAADYKDRLAARYKLTPEDGADPYDLLEQLGRKRGMLIGGGEVDTLRAANTLLDEFRAGKLGKITMEQPPKTGSEEKANDQL